MDVINSLSQIAKNSSSFEKWEDEQRSVEAKREFLAKNKPSTKEELARANALGDSIVDVVDIMDQHSEDIAENVETATSIPASLAPIAAFFASGFASGKFLIQPAVKQHMEVHRTFEDEHGESLSKFRKAMQEANPKKSEYYFYNERLLNAKAIKKYKVPEEIKAELGVLQKKWTEVTKASSRKTKIGLLVPIISTIGAFIAANIYATKLQVGSSKVARYQAREVLKDPKYFVDYTPEQIEKAKKNLENTPEEDKKSRKDKLKSGLFKGIAGVISDNKAYKQWKESKQSEFAKVDRPLTPQEVEQAKRDQEVVQRVIKKINNQAEVYSTNMEVASSVIMGGTPILGGAVGWGVSKILNAIKVIPNLNQRMVNKYGDDEAKAVYAEYTKLADDAPGKNRLFREFAEKMMDSADSKELKDVPKLQRIGQGIKRFIPVALSTKFGRGAAFGLAGFITTGVASLIIGLKLQKSSSRAGRYTAKQELLNNPQNFVGYTDKELNSVDVAPKEKPNKFKEYLMFLPNVMKQYFAYSKYTKTELKQKNQLKEELTKLDVSDSQLADAKNLQRKVFTTFEQVDDKSQDYSESVEVAAQIAKPFVLFGGLTAILAPFIAVGIQVKRGKISPNIILQKVTGFLGKSTGIMKKGFFKNYLNDVSTKISKMVGDTDIPKYVKEENSYSAKLFNQNKENYAVKIKSLKAMSENITDVKSFSKEGLKEISEKINSSSDAEVKELLSKMLEKSKGSRVIEAFEFESMDKASVLKLIKNVQQVIDNIPEKELKTIIDTVVKEFEKDPDRMTTLIQNGGLGALTSLVITPKLALLMKTASISWAAINIVMIYAIESWIGDKELKAGRLGVMKALEGLKDPAYYANATVVSKK